MATIRRLAGSLLFDTGRAADRAARVSHYLAVATLTLAEIRDSIRTSWNDFYAADAVPKPVLMPWEEAAIGRVVAPGSHVLLVGCGNGRDLIELADRGYITVGVEPSSLAVHEARRQLQARQIAASLIEGFFEDAPIPGTFDLVIFSYYCYAFIPMSARRVETLKKAKGLLNPGGHVLVSYASGTPRPSTALISLARMAGRLSRSDWRLEHGDMVWDNRRRERSYSFTHAFAAGELEAESAAARLTPVFRELAADGSVVMLLERS
jgi:SAM-dependent methyltransferase